MVKTGYVWQEEYAWHNTGLSTGFHKTGGYNQPYPNFESPESKARLASMIEVSGIIKLLHRLDVKAATREDLLRVHTQEYLDKIKKLSDDNGGDAGDNYTPFGPGGWDIAALAAGGTIAAASAVIEGKVNNAYALVRPPGHHAEKETGRGYCIFANIPVAIEYIRNKYNVKKVAIFDYDVHHGNGAQSIYWDDPDTLSISIHQDQLFPIDSGFINELGSENAIGACFNIPLPAGSGNGAYFQAIDKIAEPAITAFQPEIIMVASGFDPSPLDPLGRMTITSKGFKEIAKKLKKIAEKVCDGKIVFSHEGGYSPVHVPFCGLAVIEALSEHNTDVTDPFNISFDSSPAHILSKEQEKVINEVAKKVTDFYYK